MRSAADRARDLIRRTVVFAALLAGAALLFRMFEPGDDEVTSEGSVQERGYYLLDATLTELGPDGKPRVIVRAREIEQQLADASVRLNDLVLDYQTQKTGAWHVTADRGRMPQDRTTLQLEGNVRVTGTPAQAAEGTQAVIVTDELAYDTRANVIQTAAPVAIRFGTHELRGRGLRVALNDGTLRLESNVNGRFSP
jgi:LPS export ABC transporter protein LptC